MILRFLTGTTPFAEAMVVWARSYLVRYVPSGALELVLRISQRERHASRGQVLLATGYEHVGALVAVAILEAGCLAWRALRAGSVGEQLAHGLPRSLVMRRPELLRQHA